MTKAEAWDLAARLVDDVSDEDLAMAICTMDDMIKSQNVEDDKAPAAKDSEGEMV